MRNINIITMDHVKYSAFVVARKIMSWDEPIPEFETRYKNSLESCIITPFQKFNGKFLYSSFVDKSAILFYLMIKNHPFKNGNKRMALMTLLTFLFLNNKWLKVDIKVLYNLTVWTASSPSDAKEELIGYIKKFIKKNLIAF